MKHKDQNKLKESAGPSLESASTFSTHSPSTSLAATLASDTSLQHSVPCCRAFYDCKNMVANYLDPHTALFPDCKLKLDAMMKASPFPSTLCPCCHDPSLGPPLSFCSNCSKYLVDDGDIESPWGSWSLERSTGEIICVHLDFE